MSVTWTVQADSEREAQAALERGCAALDLEPLGRPSQVLGRLRWMARARPKFSAQAASSSASGD